MGVNVFGRFGHEQQQPHQRNRQDEDEKKLTKDEEYYQDKWNNDQLHIRLKNSIDYIENNFVAKAEVERLIQENNKKREAEIRKVHGQMILAEINKLRHNLSYEVIPELRENIKDLKHSLISLRKDLTDLTSDFNKLRIGHNKIYEDSIVYNEIVKKLRDLILKTDIIEKHQELLDSLNISVDSLASEVFKK